MGKSTDILLNPQTWDLQTDVIPDKFGLISSGLSAGDATIQHQAMVMHANKGEFKMAPILGVGVDNLLNDSQASEWEREIILQLESIGMKVEDVNLDIINHKLTIDAKYS